MKLSELSSGNYKRACIVIVLLIFACRIALLINGNVNHDNARLLFCTSEWIHGSQLYKTVIDINPPMIFYIYSIPVFMTSFFSIPFIYSFDIYLISLCAFSLVMASIIIGRSSLGNSKNLIIPLCAFIVVLLPGFDFGQREHLCILFILPYLLLETGALYGGSVPARTRFTAGVMAGIGFSIKPYFVLAYAAILVCSLVYRKRSEVLWRIENTTIYSVFCIYAFLLFYFHSDYFTVAHVTMQVYSAYESGFARLLSSNTTAVWAAGLVCLLLTVRHKEHFPALLLIFVTGTAFLTAAYVQKKGWTYHYYPVNANMFAFFAAFLWVCRNSLRAGFDGVSHRYARLAVSLLLLCAVSVAAGNAVIRTAAIVFAIAVAAASVPGSFPGLKPGHRVAGNIYRYSLVVFSIFWIALFGYTSMANSIDGFLSKYDYDDYVSVIKQKAYGKPIFFMASSVGPAFPVVLYANARYPVRYGGVGTLGGLYSKDSFPNCKVAFHSPESMSEIERSFIDDVVDDLVKTPPALLFVDERKEKQGITGSFDYMEYFSRDKRFAELMKNYVRTDRIDEFRLYERRADDAGSK